MNIKSVCQTPTSTWRSTVVVAALWLSATASGCSLTLDFDECNTNADCENALTGLVCTDQGFCVEPASSENNACVSDADCADLGARTQCVDERCVEPVIDDLPNNAGACTAEACIALSGENHVCNQRGECVSALTPRCTKLVGPIDRDNVVLIGSILPTVEFGDIGLPIQQAAELAVEEINDAGGLPGGRRLVMVGCDSSGDSALGQEAAEHLVDTLGVPVIIGPAFSSVFIDIVTDTTVPGGVMTISPSATSPTITGLPDQGLAWRTVASDVFQGVAIADRVRDLGLTKIVAFNKGDAYGRGLSDKVNEELANLGEDGFFTREYSDPAQQAPDFGGIINGALDDMPDAQVVLLLGTSEVIDIVELYEIAVAERGLTPPIYILTDGGKSADKLQTLMAADDTDPALLDRIEGTEPDHQNGDVFDSFDLRFRRRHGNPAAVFGANAYDAVYLAAYAMSALPTNEPPTGALMASTMPRLGEGSELLVGPVGINDGRNTMAAGGSVDFVGASGPLDFDDDLGEAPANVALWQARLREDGEIRFDIAGRYTIGDSGRGTWSVE